MNHLPRLASNSDPLVARITGVSHWCPAFENQGISNKNPEF
jgi:hypothetical protein